MRLRGRAVSDRILSHRFQVEEHTPWGHARRALRASARERLVLHHRALRLPCLCLQVDPHSTSSSLTKKSGASSVAGMNGFRSLAGSQRPDSRNAMASGFASSSRDGNPAPLTKSTPLDLPALQSASRLVQEQLIRDAQIIPDLGDTLCKLSFCLIFLRKLRDSPS